MRKILLLISFHVCFITDLFSQSGQSDFDFLYNVIQRSYPGFKTKTDSVSYARFAASIKKQSKKNEFEKMSALALFFE